METRNVEVSLEKAREWYKSDNKALKEVALQAYTKEELEGTDFKYITNFEDVCNALGLDFSEETEIINNIKNHSQHAAAIYMLDLVRRALNGGETPSLVSSNVYYPWVKIYPIGKEAKAAKAAAANGWRFGPTFIADNKRYTLVGGDYHYYMGDGLISLSCELGFILPHLGLLGCKSREIAEHMSRYFSKEIFEAVYTHHTGTYKWV